VSARGRHRIDARLRKRMAAPDTAERQKKAPPGAVHLDRFGGVCGTGRGEAAGAAGKGRKDELVRPDNE
jgi:hypothetical protein